MILKDAHQRLKEISSMNLPRHLKNDVRRIIAEYNAIAKAPVDMVKIGAIKNLISSIMEIERQLPQ